MATMGSGIGKTNAEIWQMFKDAHLSPQNPEHELRRIHHKWVQINADLFPTSKRLQREAAAKKRTK